MTKEELMVIWGDGSEYGLSPHDEHFMNTAFREVAMRFAQRVSAISYNMGFGDGWKDCKVSYRISSYSVDPQ